MHIAKISVGVFLILPTLALVKLAEQLDGTLIVGYLLLISFVTSGANWQDKRNAQASRWRIPERSLHLLEMLGGWPAAWLAQQILRHKTQKKAYRIIYGCIVSAHQLIAIEILTHWQISRWIWGTLAN